MKKEYDIIDKLFRLREEEIIDSFQEDRNKLGNCLKEINKEAIKEIINKIPQDNKNLKIQLEEQIDNLIADYNIILAYYNKKYYKQGFNDAINLNIICSK